jgi:lysine-ketoglutarate reductase/saccharopine dehydrogenase-like protein (TIGR00300 family)
MQHWPYEDVRIEGHLIDSGIMSEVMDSIVALDGEFETLSFEVGRTNDDPSVALLRIRGRDGGHLDEILGAIQIHGAVPVDTADAELAPAPCDGVFPDCFYSTTNLETEIRIGGSWIRVAAPEMDLGVRVDPVSGTARTVPMADVVGGDLYVVGHSGIRVHPQERPREKQAFEFMSSAVSSEKPKAQVVAEVARMLRDTKAAGLDSIAVVGPAVVHTGAAGELARLVEMGYISVLFGGNAVATHDIESALYGTSLGVSLEDGVPTLGGHEHHLRAINTIRRCGSISSAVEQGVLTKGLMYTLVKTGTPFVLAGSIRDDGPLPDVITDVIEAQNAMRKHAQHAGACLMLSTMLHSIATGNMLPASTTTVCVDINPAVVTKLADRGSWQTIGIVTDVGLFLEQLANELERTA